MRAAALHLEGLEQIMQIIKGDDVFLVHAHLLQPVAPAEGALGKLRVRVQADEAGDEVLLGEDGADGVLILGVLDDLVDEVGAVILVIVHVDEVLFLKDGVLEDAGVIAPGAAGDVAQVVGGQEHAEVLPQGAGIDDHVFDVHAGAVLDFRGQGQLSKAALGQVLGDIAGHPVGEDLVRGGEGQLVVILLGGKAVGVRLEVALGEMVGGLGFGFRGGFGGLGGRGSLGGRRSLGRRSLGRSGSLGGSRSLGGRRSRAVIAAAGKQGSDQEDHADQREGSFHTKPP